MLSDWQSYRLEDFIPFTSEVYWRLLERINDSFWPLHVLTVGLGLTAVFLALRGRMRIALILLAPAWISSGIIFHLVYYSELNWAAPWFGWAFVAQAALLLAGAAFTGRRPEHQEQNLRPGGAATWIGAAIAALALLAYPLLALAIGPGPTHAEAFGLHPDPTAIATLGILLILSRGAGTWLAIPIPFLWCLISTLTLIPLEAAWAPLPLAAGIIVLVTMAASKRANAPYST